MKLDNLNVPKKNQLPKTEEDDFLIYFSEGVISLNRKGKVKNLK